MDLGSLLIGIVILIVTIAACWLLGELIVAFFSAVS